MSTAEEVKRIVKDGCPQCTGDEDPDNHVLFCSGIQHMSAPGIGVEGDAITIDLGGHEDTWSVDPVIIWCDGCKTVLMDNRSEISMNIMTMPLPRPKKVKRGQQILFMQLSNSLDCEYGFVEHNSEGPFVTCRFWKGNSNELRTKANGENIKIEHLILRNFKPQGLIDDVLKHILTNEVL